MNQSITQTKMTPTKWLSLAIMALLLNLASSTSRGNLPRPDTPPNNHLDVPPNTTPTPNLYRECGGVGCGFGGGIPIPPIAGNCGDCGKGSGGYPVVGGSGDCGQSGGGFPSTGGCDSGNCGESGGGFPGFGCAGGDCGESGGGGPCPGFGVNGGGGCGGGGGGGGSGGGIGLPPPFRFPFPWPTIPEFPHEPYQCCPSGSCGNSNFNCPRFTLHLSHDETSSNEAKYPIPGLTAENGMYECCPRSCACENPFLCPGFTMYLSHDEPNMVRPDMSPINTMIPAPAPLSD